MSIVQRIKNFFKEVSDDMHKHKQKVIAEEVAMVKYFVEQESITCRCKGLAVPVFDASNKYHCIKCNARFSNSKHHLYSTLAKKKIFTYDGNVFLKEKARNRYDLAVQQLKD